MPDPVLIHPVDRSQKELVGGGAVTDDHSELKPNGQQKGYVVLTAAERAKGFVRPVRRSYRHVGASGPKHSLRDLTAEEAQRHAQHGYAKFETYPESESPVLGKFWTQADLDAIDKGCGSVTTMAVQIAETLARDPGFYSGGFCAHCRKHFPNDQLVWDGTQERVGS